MEPRMKKKRKTEAIEWMSQSIPWDKVFQFLNGVDIEHAWMTSKNGAPWKRGASGNDEDTIMLLMKNRLGETEAGRKLLLQYHAKYPDETGLCPPRALAKLAVNCNSRVRHDGVYKLSLGVVSRFYRFYPNGDVVSLDGSISASQVWTSFAPGDRASSYGSYYEEKHMTESDHKKRSFSVQLDVRKFGKMYCEELEGHVRASDGVLSIDSCPEWTTFDNTESDEYTFIRQRD